MSKGLKLFVLLICLVASGFALAQSVGKVIIKNTLYESISGNFNGQPFQISGSSFYTEGAPTNTQQIVHPNYKQKQVTLTVTPQAGKSETYQIDMAKLDSRMDDNITIWVFNKMIVVRGEPNLDVSFTPV